MLTVPYHPGKHMIWDHEVGRFLRRHLQRDDLFVYFHRIARTWIVAYWVEKGRRFVEVWNGTDIREFNRQDVDQLERWHHRYGETAREFRNRIKSEEAAYYARQDDQKMEATDAKKWLKKKVGGEGPLWDTEGTFAFGA